ncbi:MAG: hypothetical protein EPO22_12480 [Dehalococcoidia bacterium]|nr:MAG: hypothetical protein EPO22_12480 [Dehalococcoidia bacterium]
MTKIIERRAANPDGDLACEFELARNSAGLREDLRRAIVAPVRPTKRGVEVTFDAWAREVVLRYIDLESRCCSFLDLAAWEEAGHVILTVEGRPEARDVIANIFAAP